MFYTALISLRRVVGIGELLFGLYLILTLGNCWALGPLANPKLIQKRDTLQFQPAALAVGLV
jgi:hypothetical protein